MSAYIVKEAPDCAYVVYDHLRVINTGPSIEPTLMADDHVLEDFDELRPACFGLRFKRGYEV